MSLATRCPACGTVFRVVRDQLKVSEGWVRCGRCAEVFNAGQRLFELEAGAVSSTSSPTPGAETARGASGPTADRMHPLAAPQTAEPMDAAVDAAMAGETLDAIDAAAQAAPAPPHSPPRRPTPVPAPERAATSTSTSTSTSTPPSTPSDGEAPAAAAASGAETPADSSAAESTATPGFVQRADRAARRRQPKQRGALAALSLLLMLLLGAQVALHYRDDLAAGWPASHPWLAGACTLLGCRVEPPRHIEDLSVDSSALVRIEGSPVYRLSLVVHNRSATAVRMPAIDLALTDTQGQTTARRVLLGAELGQPADHLPARGEVALQALLDLGEQGVAGYTVELFYP